MTKKKKVLVINGSASRNSANQVLIERVAASMTGDFELTIYRDLKNIPHFDPDLSNDSPPKQVVEFRQQVDLADGILICTPEYVFSIPSGLKNAIEWCVSTTVFSDKPVGLITASTDGQKGHEELQLIMRTIMVKLTPETTLLIPGIKGRVNDKGEITDRNTVEALTKFVGHFKELIRNAGD